MKKFLTSVAVSAALSTTAFAISAEKLSKLNGMKNSEILTIFEDSRTYEKYADTELHAVKFKNRFGISVAGHMYLPPKFDPAKKYAALVISGPFGAVKEQVSGMYAQELAKAGFIALAFDPSTTGESGDAGRRDMGSPELFTEDYHAAVDFAGALGFVDSGKIGALGICGLSGMALTAAISDTRIKAVATSAMYDMSESIGKHYKGDYYTSEQKLAVKNHLAALRNAEAKSGKTKRGAHELWVNPDGSVGTFETMFPDTLPSDANAVIREFYEYYVTRAYHKRAMNSNTRAWDELTPYGFFEFDLMSRADELSPRPLLLITGENAHSKYFSDELFAKAAEPKREIVVPNATHTSLYDDKSKIPFGELVKFFRENLK